MLIGKKACDVLGGRHHMSQREQIHGMSSMRDRGDSSHLLWLKGVLKPQTSVATARYHTLG